MTSSRATSPGSQSGRPYTLSSRIRIGNPVAEMVRIADPSVFRSFQCGGTSVQFAKSEAQGSGLQDSIAVSWV